MVCVDAVRGLSSSSTSENDCDVGVYGEEGGEEQGGGDIEWDSAEERERGGVSRLVITPSPHMLTGEALSFSLLPRTGSASCCLSRSPHFLSSTPDTRSLSDSTSPFPRRLLCPLASSAPPPSLRSSLKERSITDFGREMTSGFLLLFLVVNFRLVFWLSCLITFSPS